MPTTGWTTYKKNIKQHTSRPDQCAGRHSFHPHDCDRSRTRGATQARYSNSCASLDSIPHQRSGVRDCSQIVTLELSFVYHYHGPKSNPPKLTTTLDSPSQSLCSAKGTHASRQTKGNHVFSLQIKEKQPSWSLSQTDPHLVSPRLPPLPLLDLHLQNRNPHQVHSLSTPLWILHRSLKVIYGDFLIPPLSLPIPPLPHPHPRTYHTLTFLPHVPLHLHHRHHEEHQVFYPAVKGDLVLVQPHLGHHLEHHQY